MKNLADLADMCPTMDNWRFYTHTSEFNVSSFSFCKIGVIKVQIGRRKLCPLHIEKQKVKDLISCFFFNYLSHKFQLRKHSEEIMCRDSHFVLIFHLDSLPPV